MDTEEVRIFFDRLAPDWDKNCHHDDEIIEKILDYAGIDAGCTVLDVACGTGVLFPYYLKRNVKQITGVDLSPGMISQAQRKFHDPRIELIVGNIETIALQKYDRCMVYSAFPHFENPVRLIRSFSKVLLPEGRLTIAHCESRKKINLRHENSASEVSKSLMSAIELKKIFAPYFYADILIDDDQMYVVSGVLKR